ncbi:hypothetical protein BDZ89DRAFT_1056101 [Hymenopellis radicata]|nr:hypothetical protein BDZ89DRAFT_1056101 [Hymenopellis radicata]
MVDKLVYIRYTCNRDIHDDQVLLHERPAWTRLEKRLHVHPPILRRLITDQRRSRERIFGPVKGDDDIGASRPGSSSDGDGGRQ